MPVVVNRDGVVIAQGDPVPSYEQIARAGGGIRSTVAATRAADEAQLLEHYADLLKVCKFTGLETDIAVLATDLTMAPHSSCDALTLMLQSNRTDVRQTVQFRAVFDKRKVRLQLTPVELRGLPGEIMPGLQSALQGKCPGWTVTYSADRALLAEWAP